MPTNLKRERFANKEEEAAWWEENEEAVAGAFEKAMKEGYAGSCIVVVTGSSTATRIRLGSRDLGKAREQAAKRGMHLHEYLKALIHESLRRPKRKRKPATAKHQSHRRQPRQPGFPQSQAEDGLRRVIANNLCQY